MVMVVREKERSIMKAIELGVRTVLHLFLIAALAIGCVRFLTGCTLIEKANSDGKIVAVLKETYANGGAAAVSNKIEKLVTENAPQNRECDLEGRSPIGDREATRQRPRTLSVKQAEALHVAAQRLYDGVVEKLEAKAAEAALAE